MNDLIRRQAAIDALERKKDKNAKGEIGGFYNAIIQQDIETVMKLPSVQPKRKLGKWCFDTDGLLVCSNCYSNPTNRILLNADIIYDMTPIRERMRYCPTCGAYMRGEQNE